MGPLARAGLNKRFLQARKSLDDDIFQNNINKNNFKERILNKCYSLKHSQSNSLES